MHAVGLNKERNNAVHIAISTGQGYPPAAIETNDDLRREKMRTVKFDIYIDGGWLCAAGENDTIFTQAKSIKTLMKNIDEAVCCHFDIKTGDFKLLLEFEPDALLLISKGKKLVESTCR